MSTQPVSFGARGTRDSNAPRDSRPSRDPYDTRATAARAAYANSAWRNANSSPCLLCGEPATPKWRIPCDWRTDANETFVLGWCERCEFGRILQRPTPETHALHSRVDLEAEPSSKLSVRPASFFDRLRVHLAWRVDRGSNVDQMLTTLPPAQDICELGCGYGERLAMLHGLGHHVAGVEANRIAWQRAARLVPGVARGTVEQLPSSISSQRFDVVIMNHVLEHCLDPVAALRSAKTLLKPTGSLLIEVPNNQARGARKAQSGWRWLDVPRHLNFFTKHSLITLCNKAGLRICDIQYLGYTRQFGNEWLAAEEQISQRMRLARAPSKARAWRLLLTTAFAAPERKYDSLRVVAVL